MSFKKDFNNNLLSLIDVYINYDKTFRLLLKKTSYWENIVNNLEDTENIYLEFSEDDEVEYIIDFDNNTFYFRKELDDAFVENTIPAKDILGMLDETGMPILIKPFKESEDNLKEKSLASFKKNSPNFF